METLKRRLGHSGCLFVNAIGMKGGLAILWKREPHMEIISFSQWHISTWIEDEATSSKGLLMGMHVEADASRRRITSNLLNEMKPQDHIPWLIMGKFNEILFQNEKWEGRGRSET